MYEYGSRAGVWRILREFERARPAAHRVRRGAWRCSATPRRWRRFASSATRSPATACAGSATSTVDEATERAHMREAVAIITRAHRRRAARLVHRPRQPEHPPPGRRARRLRYDSDYYGDDLPFWMQVDARRRRDAAPGRAVHARHQRHALRRARRASTPATSSSPTCATPSTRCTPKATEAPKMLSIGLHCRLLGRPGAHRRAAALPRPRAGARPRVGLPPHRHRRHWRSGPSAELKPRGRSRRPAAHARGHPNRALTNGTESLRDVFTVPLWSSG